MSPQSKPFMSVAEASRRCGTSRKSTYKSIAKGFIPVDDDGRILRAEFERVVTAMPATINTEDNQS